MTFAPVRRGGLVIVSIPIELGAAAGSSVEVGTDPPLDYPRVPPHWVHLPKQFELPGGSRNPSELGPEWSKWSRQHPHWRGGAGAAHAWIAHIRSLLAQATVVE